MPMFAIARTPSWAYNCRFVQHWVPYTLLSFHSETPTIAYMNGWMNGWSTVNSPSTYIIIDWFEAWWILVQPWWRLIHGLFHCYNNHSRMLGIISYISMRRCESQIPNGRSGEIGTLTIGASWRLVILVDGFHCSLIVNISLTTIYYSSGWMIVHVDLLVCV